MQLLISAEQQELGLSEEEIAAFVEAAAIVLDDGREKASQTVADLLKFDIPFAHSRKTAKAPLSSILTDVHTWEIILLGSGTVSATGLIAQSEYLLAMEAMGASAGATLVLVGSYALSEWVLKLMGHGRPRR